MPPCFSEGCWLGIFPRVFFCRCKAQWVHLGEKETWFEVGDLGTCDLFFNSQSSEHTVNITSSILEHPKRLPGRDLHRNFYIIYNESCYTTLDMMIPLSHLLRQPSPGSENGHKWDFARTRFCFFFSPSTFPTQTPPHHQPISLTFPLSLFLFAEEITTSFNQYGALVVDWPHKAESKSYFPPKGYAFLLFQVGPHPRLDIISQAPSLV